MNNIKKLLIGLPLFNLSIIVTLEVLRRLEMYFNPVTEHSAPVTLYVVIWLLLIMGGFAVCGLGFGAFKTIKYDNEWNEITIQIIKLTIIIECMYIVYYFLLLNDHTFIIRDASIITLKQISGYAVGCIIGKLINNFFNKQ